jgi:Flp pilus assembly protein TadG
LKAAEELESSLRQQGITKARYNVIISAMEHQLAEDLSDDCRVMLKNSVLTSLCVPKDERHEIQSRLVEMIGKVIGEVMGKLKETVERANADLAEVEKAHKGLADAAESASLALATGLEQAASKQATFAEAEVAVGGAEKFLLEKQDEQRLGDEDVINKTKEREMVGSALSTDFAAIVSGESKSDSVDSLVALATKLQLEDSLLEAMPNVLLKRPDARHSFDQMVLDQLNGCLRKRIADLEADLASQASGTEERKAVVTSAEVVLQAAKAAREVAAEELRKAEATRDELQLAKKAADQELKKHVPMQKQATKAVEKKQWDMECFGLAVDTYQEFRDRSSTTAAAVEETTDPAEVSVAASGAGA